MKKSILLFALIAIIFNANAYTISSTNGYDVNIELNLNSLAVASGCSGGWYNYGIAYSYDISFTGTNAPSSMWTLQARSIGEDGSTFISLPNNGGEGSSTSSTLTRSFSDCETATPSSLGFDTIYVQIQGPGISNQTIALHVSALPVSLMHFDAQLTNGMVQLNWATASELNNDYFTIEKSIDGVTYTQVRTINGAGNSNNILHYSSTDVAISETTYYRLKQTDFDGSFSYSQVVVVKPNTSNLKQVNVYPNPNTSGTIKVDVGGDFHLKTITVTSINGQVVQHVKPTNEVEELETLPRGVYVVAITNTANGSKQTLRIIQE